MGSTTTLRSNIKQLVMEKVKELFVIDGYKIWAYTMEEAQQHYQMIKNF